MRSGNVIHNIYETGEKQRISIYYDMIGVRRHRRKGIAGSAWF